MTQISGKCVLITGGASGLGLMLADGLARRGADIVLWDIDSEGLASAQKALSTQGVNVHCFSCDLTDRVAIQTAADAMSNEDIHVDILINNAGVVSGGYLLDVSDEQIQTTFNVNTLALFWMTRAFLPGMIHNGSGHIVTVASAAGLTGTARQTDYSASKFAAIGFDESLRVELKNLGTPVRTTIVCPYYINTGMFAGVTTRFSWLLPILKPEYVVTRTIKALESNRRRVLMPRALYSLFLMRLLPASWMDALLRIFGVHRGMDAFVGRKAR